MMALAFCDGSAKNDKFVTTPWGFGSAFLGTLIWILPMRFKPFCSRPPLPRPAAGRAGQTFRWSRSVDISSWDIHAQNVGVNNTMHGAVYDTLVEYNSKTFKPEPSLATEWKLIKPTQLRLTLRKGVKFSDGSEFTADDAKVLAGARQGQDLQLRRLHPGH